MLGKQKLNDIWQLVGAKNSCFLDIQEVIHECKKKVLWGDLNRWGKFLRKFLGRF
jgi:hypothetical protein